jgi:C1A family cysteine protease
MQGIADVSAVGMEDIVSAPATYDLRTFGRVSPVKDQGPCGSCERNDLFFIEMQGKTLKKFLQYNPDASLNKISAKFGITRPRMQRIVNRVMEETK